MTTSSAVDLSNCDREPIHIPGSIQPHGAMLVCEDAEGIVSRASANIGAILGIEPGAAIGAALEDVLGREAAHDLRNAAARAGNGHLAGLSMGLKPPGAEMFLDASIHRYDNRYIVELEPSQRDLKGAHAALDMTQALVRRIGVETEVAKIAATGARLIRAMLGYDRVMVYRFLHNEAGKVIAEARRSGMHSFLDQHFPAADIPAQARRLYLENWIRVIGDAGYRPVPLLGGGHGARPVDMSHAHLRSVSPIHCEYLCNMGVAASLSISIVVEGRLWGLIACHHDSPRTVPLALRVAAELFGQYFSLQIAVAEKRASFQAANLARRQLDALIQDFRPDESIDRSLGERLEGLSDLVACDGAGLWIDGRWTAIGVTPPEGQMPAIVELLAREMKSGMWATNELGAHVDLAGSAIAGMLAVPVSARARDYLMLFRTEEAHAIDWAGQPTKTMTPGPLGMRLTPRGSFEAWRQEVRGRSRPWTEAERGVAEAIRTFLRDVVLHYREYTEEARSRADQRRRILNDELNHRVKNILSLVKSIATQTGAHAQTVADYSAALEGRLRALSFAHDHSLSREKRGDLHSLIEAEAGLHRYGAGPERVVVSGPRTGLSERAFGALALVLHEMMTNAAKYGALSAPEGALSVTWSANAAGDCEIVWEEKGGPPVAPPPRTGFGTTLIQSSLSYDLGGSAELDYRPAGLHAVLRVPARHLTAPSEPLAEAKASAATDTLRGCSVLVVEDQAIIAMDTEAVMHRLGATDIRAFADVAGALNVLAAWRPDCAVLDFNLGDESSAVLADRLGEMGIPYIFTTGYRDSVTIPHRFSAIPIVRKPVDAAKASAALAAAFAPKAL